MSAPEGQRIDKWLWHARFARTRGAAQQLAMSGHVRVNREKVTSASRLVRTGDVLNIHVGADSRGQMLANRRQMMPAKVVWVDRRSKFEQGRLIAGIEFLASIAAHLDAA